MAVPAQIRENYGLYNSDHVGQNDVELVKNNSLNLMNL